MTIKKKILSLGIALMPWLGTFAGSGLEVVKWGGDSDTGDVNVGKLPPVDVTPGNGKFTVAYGDKVKTAQVEILESGRVVYTDVENSPRNTSVTYRLRNATPGSTYLVRVKADGVVRAVEEVSVDEQ